MSKNAVGIAVMFLSLIGIEVTEGGVLEVVSAIGTIVSFGLMIWNQAARPDVANFFFKNDKL